MTSANKNLPNQSMMIQHQTRHFQQLQHPPLPCYNQVSPNLICRSPGTVNKNNLYEHKQQQQPQQPQQLRNTNYSKVSNDDDTKSSMNRSIEEDLNDMEMTFLFGHSSNEDLANDISQIDITEDLQNMNGNGNNNNNNPKKQKSIKTKSKKKRSKSSKARKHSKSDDGFGYEPHPKHRARGNIQISKQLTEEIIPCSIAQYITNLYSFMDKLSAMRYFPDKAQSQQSQSSNNWGNIEIFNYGFLQKEGKVVLFAVAEHQDINHHKSRGYGLKMINRLFTASELMSKYNLNLYDLPISIYDTNKYKSMLNDKWKIKSILMDISSRTNLLKQCQWHKINIFKRINNKRRMTLSCTKPEFIIKVVNFSNKIGVNNDINLIPIILFNETDRDFVIEWCWIIRIEWNPNIDIAVSFRFDDHNNCAKIKSIHLDKDYLMDQHQMALPNHDCHCFDHFNSYIDDLAVGNPDDLKNKINYYLQVIDDLKQYKQDMDKLKDIAPDDIQGFQSLQHEVRGKLKPNNSPTSPIRHGMNMNMYHQHQPHQPVVAGSNEVNHKLSLPMMINGNGHYPNNNRSMSLSPMFRQNSTQFIPSPNAQSNRSISPNASNTTMISPMYSTNTQFHIN